MSESNRKKLGVIKGKVEDVPIDDCKELRDPMFVGLDPSYNSFGIIVIDKDGEIIEEKLLKSEKDEAENRILELEKEFEFIKN